MKERNKAKEWKLLNWLREQREKEARRIKRINRAGPKKDITIIYLVDEPLDLPVAFFG